MTLMEVMIALAIFGITAGGIVCASGLAHRTSVENIADSVALHTAESIMEQIRIMPYEATLLKSCVNATPLPIDRYVPANTGGAAKISTQIIPVNTDDPIYVEHVTLGAALNDKTVQVATANLPMGVRILLRNATNNGAPGITVELIYYRYRTLSAKTSAALKAATPVAVRTLRTFIPKSLQ